jgi:DNA-binding NarL/FixJ family response regulator
MSPQANPKRLSKPSAPLRIVLADDHAMLLDAMRRQFENDRAFSVIAIAKSLDALRNTLKLHRVDAVLLDIQLGEESGLDIVPEIRTQWPWVRVIMLSMFEQALYRDRAFELGAEAYVSKGARFKDLRSLLLQLPCEHAHAKDHQIWKHPGAGRSARLTLTKQEIQVIQALAKGKQIKEVADGLGISASSVGTYLRRAKDKTGAPTRVELFHYAHSLGSCTPRSGNENKGQIP